MGAPTQTTLDMVVDRDFGLCAKCAKVITGERGVDWSLHHRCPRAAGGTKRAWVNLPGNLVLLHGSGVITAGKRSCHGEIESERDRATDAGFLVSAIGRRTASEVPIDHAVHGLVLLNDMGRWERAA